LTPASFSLPGEANPLFAEGSPKIRIDQAGFHFPDGRSQHGIIDAMFRHPTRKEFRAEDPAHVMMVAPSATASKISLS
jgi:hypothetical protein